MPKVDRFEDLVCWQKARELAGEIFELTCQGSFAKDYALRDQINKSAGSVMDNIAEGFGRGSRQEFVNFLVYAIGSANEVKSQLYRASDRNHITKSVFEQTYDKADHTAKMMVSLINTIKRSATGKDLRQN
ncbi:MAG: four helix bundle protein [Cytophagales bacterium]|nr:four helix bundle protein [Cytophagales bacterium]